MNYAYLYDNLVKIWSPEKEEPISEAEPPQKMVRKKRTNKKYKNQKGVPIRRLTFCKLQK